jgi:hypothetical protein
MTTKSHRVLIVTGDLISPYERSLVKALIRQRNATHTSHGVWLNVESKLMVTESILASLVHQQSRACKKAHYGEAVQHYFTPRPNLDSPHLTEVVLATLLHQDRETLLDFQRDLMWGHPILRGVFAKLHSWAHRRLEAELKDTFADHQISPANSWVKSPNETK